MLEALGSSTEEMTMTEFSITYWGGNGPLELLHPAPPSPCSVAAAVETHTAGLRSPVAAVTCSSDKNNARGRAGHPK